MQLTAIVQTGLFGFFIGGSGIGMGGFLAYGMIHARRNMIPVFVSAAVGTMTAFIVFEIFPESIRLGGLIATLAGALAGYGLTRKIDQFTHRIFIITNDPRQDQLLQSGMLLSFAIGLHNFPTGVALGSSFMDTPEIAQNIGLTMVIHAIPEGLTLGLPLALSKIRPLAVLVTAIMVAVPTGLGASLGYLFGIAFPSVLSFMLSLAAGTMVYVTYFEILLPAWKEGGPQRGTIGFVGGWALGIIFISLL